MTTMPQKVRSDKIANFNPDAKVASPPIDYSKARVVEDKRWLAICIIMIVAFFAVGGVMHRASKKPIKLSVVGSPLSSAAAAFPELVKEYKKCTEKNFKVKLNFTTSSRARHLLEYGALPPGEENRRLSTDDALILEHHRVLVATINKTVDEDWTMFDLFEENMDITMGLVGITGAVAVLWILLLQVAAMPAVWITLGVKIVFLIYIGSLAADVGVGGVAAFFFVVAALAIVWCARNTDKIKSAADMMAVAAMGLSRNPSLVPTCLCVYVPFLLIVYAYISFSAAVPLIWEFVYAVRKKGGVDVEYCDWQIQPWAIDAQRFLTFGFYFFTGLVAQLRLFTTVGVISTWYYQVTEGKPVLTAPYWMAIGLSKSLGSLTIGATIAAICDYIDKKSRKWCWCLDPVAWVTKFFMICFKAFIMSLTRMNTAIHAFTGESFCKCTTITRAIMKRNFVGGLATEYISSMVMSLATFVFSVGMTFTAWYLFEKEYKDSTGLLTHADQAGWELWFWSFLVLFCVWNTYITVMIFAVWIAPNVKGVYLGVPVIIPLAAIFIGCVSHIVFEYILGLVRDATTAMLMSVAVDRDNGTSSNGDAEVVAIVQAAPCLYAPEGAVVAEGTDLKRRSSKSSKHVV